HVTLEPVLMVGDGDSTEIGAGAVAGAKVVATVVAHRRGRKLRVFTYKPKKRHRRTLGHRSQLTELVVEEVTTATSSSKRRAEKPVAEKPVAEKPVAEKRVADKPVAEKPAADALVAQPTEAEAAPPAAAASTRTRARRAQPAADAEAPAESDLAAEA